MVNVLSSSELSHRRECVPEITDSYLKVEKIAFDVIYMYCRARVSKTVASTATTTTKQQQQQ